MQSQEDFRSAFVAFVGRPNAGKSTLLNAVIGEELSIVTSLPQTTQRNLRGIYNDESLQLVFVDTPGIHRGKHALNRAMFRESAGILVDAGIDIVCYVVDMSRPSGPEEDEVAGLVSESPAGKCIIFNKTDLCTSVEQYERDFLSRYPGLAGCRRIALCATSGLAGELFLDTVGPLVPRGPKYFPQEYLTDATLRFLAAEFIRKQIIEATSREVPHAAFVEILSYEERNEEHRVEATVHVETKGQKGIVIGRKGKVMQRIQRGAEKDLSRIAGARARIRCHVKVTPKWRDNSRFLAGMGMKT